MLTMFKRDAVSFEVALRIPALIVLAILSYVIDPDWLTVCITMLLGALSSGIVLYLQAILALAFVVLGSVIAIFFPAFLDFQEILYRALQVTVCLVLYLFRQPLFITIFRRERNNSFAAVALSVLAVCLSLISLSRHYSLSYLGWAIALLIFAQHFKKNNVSRLMRWAPGLLFSLIVMFAVLELGSRLLLPTGSKPGDLYIADKDAIYTLCPGGESVYYFKDNSQTISEWRDTISSQGIRDREYGPKAPDEFRIVTLGDSYTMGHCLKQEETFQRELESLLNQGNTAKRITVINCGVGGYAPWQERIFLQKRGFGFEPDLVVLQLFPANDISGSYTKVGKYLHAFDIGWEMKLIDFRRQQEFPFYLERWCQRHSNLYSYLCSEFGQEGLLRNLALQSRLIPKIYYAPPVIKCSREGKYETCLQEWYPELQEAWSIFRESIIGIRDDCLERGIELAVFSHREYSSLKQAFWEDLNGDFPDSPYEANKDIRLIEEMVTELGILYIDVHKAFMAYSTPEDLYYIYDGHFTPQGAKVLAECLYDSLKPTFTSHRYENKLPVNRPDSHTRE